MARGGSAGFADDVLGGGWTLLSRRAGAPAALDDTRRSFLAGPGVRAVHASLAPVDSAEAAVDLDLTYRRWFDAVGADVVLVRPDFYVFGTAARPEALPALVEELRQRIAGTSR
ncbi:hypothetical protein [Streptomyces sp. URMC 129]|uniref:hypothetical protein n=1 Tax=Streptomyces sp. URMC 129 TaxID=3423407 RepID=UPI003F1ABF68